MSNIKLSDEVNARIYSKDCIGCIATKTELMLSLFSGKIQILDGNNQPEKEVQFVDIFLSKSHALKLLETLKEAIPEK